MQLVVQFRATSTEDFNRLLSFEANVMRQVESFALFDGHDYISEEFSLFLITDQPKETLDIVRQLAETENLGTDFKAACRGASEKDFVVLWPPTLSESTIK